MHLTPVCCLFLTLKTHVLQVAEMYRQQAVVSKDDKKAGAQEEEEEL